jgi:DNA-binding transcriptional LysR family regulator
LANCSRRQRRLEKAIKRLQPHAIALVAPGALVSLLPNYRKPELEIVALYPNRQHLTTKVRVFLQMLAERFPEWCAGSM